MQPDDDPGGWLVTKLLSYTSLLTDDYNRSWSRFMNISFISHSNANQNHI
jgi:hypothetical protein